MKLTLENGAVIEDTKDNLIKTENEEVTCGCGNPSLKIMSHIDGIDFYAYNYVCQCGNSISITEKRKEVTYNA